MARKIAGILMFIAGLSIVLINFSSWQESRASITPITEPELQKYESRNLKHQGRENYLQ